ncbi:hypothetical protein HGRIS_002986 [Hohenbuehelia grisea]|uniref:Uncharacterized protein n=1 Tax=Hohenbuehelia grisea TaxID=104357 RepID=A0ABR3JNC5_9AGAR
MDQLPPPQFFLRELYLNTLTIGKWAYYLFLVSRGSMPSMELSPLPQFFSEGPPSRHTQHRGMDLLPLPHFFVIPLRGGKRSTPTTPILPSFQEITTLEPPYRLFSVSESPFFAAQCNFLMSWDGNLEAEPGACRGRERDRKRRRLPTRSSMFLSFDGAALDLRPIYHFDHHFDLICFFVVFSRLPLSQYAVLPHPKDVFRASKPIRYETNGDRGG